ncbi:MAG TPA: GatB/YqeY domain-containing protein [Blastocatellia bacterium]|nr:GatB/YqeY domain-containing protein [Blastocatellia bacterium]
MPIVDQINRDLTEAMKAKEVERLSALRMVKTALKLRETELPGEVDDAEAMKVLNTLLKQRRDAAEQYRAGNREDLAQKEEREAVIIQTYLPASASEEEMSRAVDEAITEAGATSMKDMGAVMKSVRTKLEGKTVDGKALSDMVKARLSAVSGR